MQKSLIRERDGIRIVLKATVMGDDLNISLHGGDRSHIGAVAVAQARPSLQDAGVLSASTSVITILGHKEDMVAREVAGRIASATGGVVSVSCGIHMDDAEREQIKTAVEMVTELVEEFIENLKERE